MIGCADLDARIWTLTAREVCHRRLAVCATLGGQAAVWDLAYGAPVGVLGTFVLAGELSKTVCSSMRRRRSVSVISTSGCSSSVVDGSCCRPVAYGTRRTSLHWRRRGGRVCARVDRIGVHGRTGDGWTTTFHLPVDEAPGSRPSLAVPGLLTSAATTPLNGKLADTLGRRPVMLFRDRRVPGRADAVRSGLERWVVVIATNVFSRSIGNAVGAAVFGAVATMLERRFASAPPASGRSWPAAATRRAWCCRPGALV
jgi:hypothetical protein